MNCKATVDIKKFLSLYDNHFSVQEIGKLIREAFQKSTFGNSPDSHENLFFILDRLCDEENDKEAFDNWLMDLCDWADYNEVWLGV